MTDRISLLIQAKNLSAAQFADEIGVQRSSISHLMSGRNKPSLDLIQKTLQRFPEVSSEWLLFGKGEMVRELNLFETQSRLDEIRFDEKQIVNPEPVRENEVVEPIRTEKTGNYMAEFKNEVLKGNEVPRENENNNKNKVEYKQPQVVKDEEPAKYMHIPPRIALTDEIQSEPITGKNRKQKAVDQIIVLYDDHTFIAYSPGN
jgi:transcriptional regulator with XRE-family HTH domain